MSLGQPIYCKKHRKRDLDSCEECDKERENVTYYRGIRLSLCVDKDWLTNKGEESEASGWEWLEGEIVKLISRLDEAIAGVRIEFEEWEND